MENKEKRHNILRAKVLGINLSVHSLWFWNPAMKSAKRNPSCRSCFGEEAGVADRERAEPKLAKCSKKLSDSYQCTVHP